METNKPGDSDQYPALQPDQITNDDYKGDQPNPADPKPGIEKPEIEIPDFDTDGTVTKSNLETVESNEILDNDDSK